MTRQLRILVGLLLCTASGLAQKNELDMTLGNTWSSSVDNVNSPNAAFPFTLARTSNLTYEAVFARQLADFRLGTLSLELTAAGFPSHFDNVSSLIFFPSHTEPLGFSSVFITPGAKFTFLPNRRIAPFASAGAGLVRVTTSDINGISDKIDYGAAFQFGGGVDVRTPVRFVSLRTEVRDFFAMQSGLSSAIFSVASVGAPNTHRNNVLLGGGAVFRF